MSGKYLDRVNGNPNEKRVKRNRTRRYTLGLDMNGACSRFPSQSVYFNVDKPCLCFQVDVDRADLAQKPTPFDSRTSKTPTSVTFMPCVGNTNFTVHARCSCTTHTQTATAAHNSQNNNNNDNVP